MLTRRELPKSSSFNPLQPLVVRWESTDENLTNNPISLYFSIDSGNMEFILDENVIVERICGRFSCITCGAGYHDTFQCPKIPGMCDSCSGVLFDRRKDDNEETVRTRLKHHHRYTAPIIAFYCDQDKLYRISGMLEIEAITKKIKEILFKNA